MKILAIQDVIFILEINDFTWTLQNMFEFTKFWICWFVRSEISVMIMSGLACRDKGNFSGKQFLEGLPKWLKSPED